MDIPQFFQEYLESMPIQFRTAEQAETPAIESEAMTDEQGFFGKLWDADILGWNEPKPDERQTVSFVAKRKPKPEPEPKPTGRSEPKQASKSTPAPEPKPEPREEKRETEGKHDEKPAEPKPEPKPE